MHSSFPVFPHDHDSEAALLSHLVRHPEQAAGLLKDLSVPSFDHPHHCKIFWLIGRHHRMGVPWDAGILRDALLGDTTGGDEAAREEARQVLGTFQELAGQHPDTTEDALQEHVQRVFLAAEKRGLQRLLIQSSQQLMEGGAQPEDICARMEDFRRTHARGPEMDARLKECLVTNLTLGGLPLPPRRALMDEFFREGDLGFIYAPRGAGKTWLAMLLANARAQNQPLGLWKAGECAARVLYVDGEMLLADTKMRSDAIGTPSENFFWLHGDLVFERTLKTINLCEREWQQHITALCRARGVTELYLDNLSALVRGMDENDNDDWRELMLPWLLELRRMKISVVIVAHAGRAEHMRGASGKEDQALWVLKLKPADEEMRGQGAAFVTEFTKSRNTRGNPPTLLWRLHSGADAEDRLHVTCQIHGYLEVMLQHIRDGVSRNKELAELMGVAPGTISKLAQKAAANGRIAIRGGLYLPSKDQPAAQGAELDLVA